MKMPQIEAFFWLACKFRIRDFMLNLIVALRQMLPMRSQPYLL